MLRNLNFKFRQIILSSKIFVTVTPPHLYYRVMKNAIKNSLRLYSPSSAILGVTYKCQCNCVHCSAGLYDKNFNRELKTNEWFSLLDEISKLGVPRINISGGEALLREDILEIITYASKKFVTILESNGQLLTEEIAGKLKKSNVSCVAVSIDSYVPVVHNALRGIDGCFEKAVTGIANCRKVKLPCLISTYLTKERANRGNIDNLMALARELDVLAVRVMPPRPVGSFSCHIDSLLDKESENYIMEHIDPGIAYFKGMPAPKVCGIFTHSTFYISPYGQLQPCPFMPLCFGNIKKEKLAVILNKMWSHSIFSCRQDKKCLVLNSGFRDRYLNVNTGNKKESILFPINIL